MLSHAWIVVALPFALALLGFAAGRYAHYAGPVVASVGPASLVALGAAALARTAGTPSSEMPWTSALAASGDIAWLVTGDHVVRLGYAIDSLAALMLLVVGVVALAVVVFSAGYMAGDPGWNRYFALISLFVGSMALLVVADSFIMLFIGWELVGASSYLLIGFWYTKPAAVAAAIKAFVTTRVADVAMLLGLAVLWAGLGTLEFSQVAQGIAGMAPASVSAAAVLIGLGAMGKSAQFPFHGWLPDAMEGPTPVSALIHAATMVAAGVYLVVRVRPLFDASPAAQTLLLGAGIISAFGAAVIAVAQDDIKKVLAYSTISQLGFMFVALGVGAYEAAFFHLITHAAFKGLLFLASGSVIHGSGTQELAKMGGLRKAMPVTFGVWCVGAFALVGIPGFSGFFSKDLVIERVWHASPALGTLLFASAGLTALYMARATRLAFFGVPAEKGHAHESPKIMLVPLLGMAVPAVGVGWAGTLILGWLGADHEPLVIAIAAVAVGVAAVGMFAGWMLGTAKATQRTELVLGDMWDAFKFGFGWDRAIARVIVEPSVALARGAWAILDRLVADGAAEGLALIARATGGAVSRLQNGNAQSYSATMVLTVLALFIFATWLGR